MFDINKTTMEITMHRGDTGAWKVKGTRKSGTAWTDDDRMIFSVKDANGTLKIKRYYRLDTEREVNLGDGIVEIELHNDDTDKWADGVYSTELRFIVLPVWDTETIPDDDMVDALRTSAHIIEGGVVRTKIQSTITIKNVLAEV